MQPSPDVTVVIPARNAAADIGSQLAALRRQTVTDFEVVVSDNGSTDGTAEAARAHAGDLDLRVVDSSERAGVSHARNAGMAVARGTKILICDADDEVDEGWVAAMSAALDRFDIVGGHLDVSRINGEDVRAWTLPPTRQGLPVTMSHLPYAVGANLGIRRSAATALGGFDESYVGGHEEVDFSWRAQGVGLSVGYAADGVVHYRLRNSLRKSMRQRYWYGRSYAQLYRRFRAEVPQTPLRTELRSYARLARSLPRDIRKGRLGFWLVTAAWTGGRIAGDLRYRVRCPL